MSPAVDDGRRLVVVESVSPEIDGGQFAIKRVVGDRVVVECDAFVDGHDAVGCVLRHRLEGESEWHETPMVPLGNDRWRGEFCVRQVGRYRYTVVAWIDRFGTWARDLAKRVEAGQDVAIDLEIGARLVDGAAGQTHREPASRLRALAAELRAGGPTAAETALGPELAELMAAHAEHRWATAYRRELPLTVDPERARFGAWYELFPRSCAAEPGRHGTLRDVAARLPHVARMGFDVLYLPPIHSIGRTYRKGRDNRPTAGPADPGSPWAIGAAEGGHKAVHPQLGTLDDLRYLVDRARELGLEIALDLAFQCSPDHPYVEEHPDWFLRRPDGTVQYAENPPKKYQDIYPFDFDCEDWHGLWDELTGVVLFWVDQGVRIFRVDNPHTKPFAFWEHLIGEVKRRSPDVIFLSEAFTRPKVMYRLAKLGFSQSYTYFAWRNTPAELIAYLTELSQTEVREYLRPSFWPNTPDILTEQLQLGGRAAFMARVALAATLSASYGVYGPAYELCIAEPRELGSEEYLNSEKYEIKHWDWDAPDGLRDYLTRLNRIRRENPALHWNDTLRFHPVDNDRMIAYSKSSPDGTNLVLIVVNTDPHNTQAGWVELALAELGLSANRPFRVHNLMSDARYLWHGPRNYLELNPQSSPARILRIERQLRTERDFEYYY